MVEESRQKGISEVARGLRRRDEKAEKRKDDEGSVGTVNGGMLGKDRM